MFRLFSCMLSLWMLLLSVGAFAQVSAVPTRMNFQGRLTRPDGTPVADGSHNLQFSLYSASVGGTLWWQRSVVGVPVRNGTFAVLLDFTSGYQNGATYASLFGASALYLAISINGGTPLTPRQQFVTVAYAMKADRVTDGAITSASIADGTITAADFAPTLLNPLVWLLGGNTGVTSGFLGTTDTNPLELRTNNRRAMRYTYGQNTASAGSEYRGMNVLGGADVNEIGAAVVGATIAGGGADYFSFNDLPNRVLEDFGTIGGGQGNTASGRSVTIAGGTSNTASANFTTIGGGGINKASSIYATVGGGFNNTASGAWSSIAGGGYNLASGVFSAIPGGTLNTAAGAYSFAAGRRAKANHEGAFVWADSTDADFLSTADDQVLIRAAGGVGIGMNTPEAALHVKGLESNGTNATLKLTSGTQTLLLDGNEIDTNGALYLNYNTTGNIILAYGGGSIGIGDSSPSYKLDVNGSLRCYSFTNSSDARYKTNVATFENALDTVLNLRGVTFDWKRSDFPDRNFSEGKQIGFLAQEVEKVLPELVTTDVNGYKSVAYINMVPVLVEAIKQQQKQREADRAEIKAMRRDSDSRQEQIESLRTENAELRAKLEALAEAFAQLRASRERQ